MCTGAGGGGPGKFVIYHTEIQKRIPCLRSTEYTVEHNKETRF